MTTTKQVTETTQWGTVQDAADYYGVSTQTIRKWIANGQLRAKRVGPRFIRVDMQSLADFGRRLGA